MGLPPPPTPPPPTWKEIDDWASTTHEPAEEGPAALLSQAEIEALADAMTAEAGTLTASPIRDHVPDALIAVLVIAFIVLAVAQRFWYAPVDQLTINAPGGLPAFHVIVDSDLTIRRLPPQTGTIASPRLARGRYLLQYIPKGTILRENQLSRTSGWDARLKGLSVIEIPIRLGASEPPREAKVTLIVSPRAKESPAGVIVKDIPLLSIRRTSAGVWAAAALSGDQLESLKPLLGGSDIFLSRAIP